MNRFAAHFCLLIATPLLLTQCGSLEKKECENIHWATQGFNDGAEGRYSRLSQFLSKCATHDVSVGSDEYLEGYQKGLDKFCSEESGFSRGIQGLTPEKICEDNKKYAISYDSGKQNYCTYDIGVKDAQNAKPARLFCERDTQYFQGFQDGLKKFCTSESGYKYGFEGKKETQVCTGDLLPIFYGGYKRGRVDFLRRDNEKQASSIQLAEAELKLVNARFTEKLAEAYELPAASQDPYVVEKRLKLDSEIKLLKEKKSKLEQEIFDLQKKINQNNSDIGRLAF
ncbi:MAG: DUF2799 domain-containing protein [Bdellovibrionaceae bacterium]|nr:DUF2799 domain-containing protein [Pseudobdellovibrionaceae bacterium]